MKKLIALILACAMILTSCAPSNFTTSENDVETSSKTEEKNGLNEEISHDVNKDDETLDFSVSGLDDENLLDYVEDNVYEDLITQLESEEYIVENVEAIYYPKEYIEALSSNSQKNLYFGYTSEELNAQFQGTKYVFTLGEDGQTIAIPMETVTDDIYIKAMEDVIIGTGVILICVTVSVVASPAAPAVGMIFAASASTGTAFALESGAISFAAAAIVKGYETESFEQAIKAGVEAAGEGFKWGAISGIVAGGTEKAFLLKQGTKGGLTMNQVAKIQKESGYPIEIIARFNSMEQYQICKEAGLTAKMVSGKTALIRNIDLDYVDNVTGKTNLQLMLEGKAPYDPTGQKYQLHHVGQKNDSPLAILTNAEHRQNGNDSIWHILTEGFDNPSSQPNWKKIKEDFWIAYAKMAQRGLI